MKARPMKGLRHHLILIPSYTAFDSFFGGRIFLCEDSSSPDLCSVALVDSKIAGAPLARRLQHELVRLLGPQIAITRNRPGQHCRTVVIDLAPFGGDVSVHDALPGQTVMDLSSASNTHTLPIDAISRLSDAMCDCMVSHVITDAFRALRDEADVITFYLLRPASAALSVAAPTLPTSVLRSWTPESPHAARPFNIGDARPPVPPIPDTVPATSSATQPFCVTRFTARRAASHAQEVVRLAPGEGRYTSSVP